MRWSGFCEPLALADVDIHPRVWHDKKQDGLAEEQGGCC
jgi:hypothetical protein